MDKGTEKNIIKPPILNAIGSALIGYIIEKFLDYLDMPIWIIILSFILIGIWFLISVIFLIRSLLLSFREKKQYKSFFTFLALGDSGRKHFNINKEKFGYKWMINISIPHNRAEEYNSGKIDSTGIVIEDIKGPLCPNDSYEMIEEQTFFGKYKYSCPNCEYKSKNSMNTETLQYNIKKNIEGDHNL